MSQRVLKRRFYGEQMQTQMNALVGSAERINSDLDAQGYTGRRVLGYKIPEWQRGEKWTVEQCVSFVESCWLGAGIGGFMVNMCFKDPAIDNILLDGLQRLRAIERYVAGEFAVPGEDGNSYYWTELTSDEKNGFYRIPFPWILTKYDDEQTCKEAYNRHNFGGTAHLYYERAL